jgi:hypothetical protein
VNRVLAGIAVADVDAAALPWYERLFGRSADELPTEGLAEWHVPSGGVVQLIASAEGAGRSLLTLDFDDLNQELAAMRDRGTRGRASASGYHLNKRHWNTVIIDGSLPDDAIRDVIEDSYDLVVSKLPRVRRRALRWSGDP